MVHYVLLKFKAGTDVDAIELNMRETYRQLEQELPFLTEPFVWRNCVDRDSNADIMATIHLDNATQLKDYLTHPLHVQWLIISRMLWSQEFLLTTNKLWGLT